MEKRNRKFRRKRKKFLQEKKGGDMNDLNKSK
jgi:hypothetical protein